MIGYYEEGYRVVVDCDLKNYFDTINHQILRNNLEYYIYDKVILRIIWNFLKSGLLWDRTPEFFPFPSILGQEMFFIRLS